MNNEERTSCQRKASLKTFFIRRTGGLSLHMLKNTLLEATEAAAKEILRFNDLDFKIDSKQGINDLVTEVDHASEKAIIETIKKNFPQHHILSEECGDLVQDSRYKWIIDPIDGTVNFAHRIPICCISIAVEYNKKMILGAIYNPYINELFVAERGKGSTMNDKKISVSKKEKLINACLVTGFPYTYIQ